MPRKMIIDTDTASDDAVAIMMALRHPDIEVEAITVVSGNMPLQQGSINARFTVELCGMDTPVYEGADRPMVRETHHAEWFHGPDGMGDMNYPAPKAAPAEGHAVDVLIDTIKANPGIIVVTLGPMTNLAMAIERAPEIAENVSRCVVMGGAANVVGNVTPAAEYNIWCDPEAARICFRSGMPMELVGWELCRGAANLDDEDMRHCKEVIDTKYSHMVVDSNVFALDVNRNWLGDPGIGLPDPVAMAIAIDPTICSRSSKHYVEIETDGEFTRGMTVVDELNVGQQDAYPVSMWDYHREKGEPWTTACWELDAKKWKDLLYALCQDEVSL